ncbi:hypothetical protein Tco_0540269 [Tanacetum coccineum]
MNEKSIDTTKARQDLKNLGIRSELWLGQNKNGKCSKPHARYSFTPDNIKKFCQFIKGVKLLDRFGSNFKHKVADNDSNITGMKSHDYHIMMQRLLPYGLQHYLHIDVAKPIIELCSFFKQICSRTLMEDDMDDHDVIHFNNSIDLALSTSLNDLDFATLNIDGQSTDVEAPPDIIDVDEDDDFIDDKDGVPQDLVNSNNEVLVNDDDDDVLLLIIVNMKIDLEL